MSMENLTETEQFFYDAMQRANIPVTEAQAAQAFDSIATEEGLVFKNPGDYSPFWRFVKSAMVLPFLWIVEYIIRTVMPSMFVKTATGVALEMRGWVYDEPKKGAVKTKGVITFTRSAPSVAVSIAAGKWIKTAPINGRTYRVKTTAAASFTAGEMTLQVPVEAEQEGAAYNLAPGYFVILEEPITGIVSVTNAEGWITSLGGDEEDDDEYRARLRAKFTTVSDHHVNSVYKAIISRLTGFAFDRIYIDHTQAPRGPGSADAYVLFDAGVPGEATLQEINDYIRDQGYHGHGDDMEVKAMPESLHNISCTLWLPAGAAQAIKDEVQAEAEQMIRAAFRENSEYPEVTRVAHFSRFSFIGLGARIMARRSELISVEFANADIVSNLDVPRIDALTVTMEEVS
ncbi:hypothetical protein GJQ54_11095 [Oceanospirillaceae bacterium ASx5O]|nr:hypothetical protein GJQ54_11095 [Oceanospirillaceae bacterium ASx5O]